MVKDDGFIKKSGYHENNQKVGILLVNLGTPDSPTYASLIRYLAEFLGDRRVIKLSKWLWYPILYGIILPFRSAQSAAKYRMIWRKDGSPLRVYSQGIANKLAERLSSNRVFVECGMTYGNPSIADGLKRLRDHHVRKIVVVPLFPQYAESSVASVYDRVATAFLGWRFLPELHIVNQFADRSCYIKAIAQNILSYWEKNGRGDKLLLSFHGIPADSLGYGDPYSCFCQKTARLLREELGVDDDYCIQVYQSRFGKKRWLEPYCDDALRDVIASGARKIDIVAPGFMVDCLETLEEIKLGYRELVKQENSEADLRYIPCLNDSEGAIDIVFDLIKDLI